MENEKQKTTKKSNNFKKYLNKRFKISDRNSTIKSEVVGGLVNFLMLVYVMVVIPNIMTGGLGGTALWNALFLATIITVIFTTFLMAVGANLPLVSAPGIGLTSYFATLMSNGTYTFSQTLTIALVAGVLFIILTLVGFRKKLIEGLPKVLVLAIPAGIGLFILNIGLNSTNSGILDLLVHGPTHLVNGQMVVFSAIVSLVGLITILVLQHYKVKGSIFFGILAGTILHFIIQFAQGINPFASLVGASWFPPFKDLFNESFFKFDFAGTFLNGSSGIFASIMVAVIIIFSYILVDLFDTVGTLYGATKGTELVNEKGEITNVNKAFWVDSISTVFGALFGVTGCTVYVESAAGIKSGARTGLSSLVVVLLFVGALFMSPIFMLIPASATAPALIYVGISMFASVSEITFTNIYELVPALFTVVLMPLTNNIAHGIGGGLILYVLLMLFAKKGKKVNLITYILAIMFIIFFATQNIF